MILDRLSKLGAREKVGLAVAVLVLLAMLVDRLVVQSVLNRSRELSREISNLSGEVDYQRRVLARKAAVETEYARVIGLVDVADSEAEAIDRMKDQIDGLAQASGLRLDSWEERRPEKHEAYDENFVVVRQFESTMDSLASFLHDLREAEGLFRVDEFQVAPVKGSDKMRGSMIITKIARVAR